MAFDGSQIMNVADRAFMGDEDKTFAIEVERVRDGTRIVDLHLFLLERHERLARVHIVQSRTLNICAIGDRSTHMRRDLVAANRTMLAGHHQISE